MRPIAIRYPGAEIADVDGILSRALTAEDSGRVRRKLMVRPELLALAKDGERYPSAIAAEITEIFGKGGAIQFRARDAAAAADGGRGAGHLALAGQARRQGASSAG